jgi:hypothetical protein
LPEVLNVLFATIDAEHPNLADSTYKKALTYLERWIRFKAAGIVAPFQQLSKEMQARNTDKNELETLLPVVGGTEQRLRSHIFIDPKQTSSTLQQVGFFRQPEVVLPRWFQENASLIWVMESSLDAAVFYALSGEKAGESLRIMEYELENKYPVRLEGTPLMDAMETELQNRFGIQSHLDSKYKACVEAFGW